MNKEVVASVNRKAEIIAAAIEVFAETGYYRATTSQVAERANISQPYVFRFFATKEALLLEALEVSLRRLLETLKRVIEQVEPKRIESQLFQAYEELLLRHKNEILLQMQAQTIQEQSIRDVMRKGYKEIRSIIYDAFKLANVADPVWSTKVFLAKGMLANVSVALDLPELREE